MAINKKVGICAYGTAFPKLAILTSVIEAAHGKELGSVSKSLGVERKTVPDKDEDAITLAVAASYQAFWRLDKAKNNHAKKHIGAIFMGSESHPYAVKPSGTVIQAALGLPESVSMADLQFACKAGTQALQIGFNYVKAGSAAAALAIGADTAQAAPGDVLEYTAASAAAAIIVGTEIIIAEILETTSVASDTPDFWRRPNQSHPSHAGRFSGEPAYFSHILSNTRNILAKTGLKPAGIDHCIFHTPNAKFPRQIASELGFTPQQLEAGLIVPKIGNSYAAASLVGLAAVLDIAQAGQKILLVSYGSGAGSDAFILETTPQLIAQRKIWPSLLRDTLEQQTNLSYQQYRSHMETVH